MNRFLQQLTDLWKTAKTNGIMMVIGFALITFSLFAQKLFGIALDKDEKQCVFIVGIGFVILGFVTDFIFRKKQSTKNGDVNITCEIHQKHLITALLKIYKKSLVTFCPNGVLFRVNYLNYDTKNDSLVMYVQDDAYEDAAFETTIIDGVKADVKVCKAVDERRIIMENLTKHHTMKYSDSPIPPTLKSVIAYPIISKNSLIGAVALDCNQKIEEIGISTEDIKSYFLALCTAIKEVKSND
jgi:hypothetical protein